MRLSIIFGIACLVLVFTFQNCAKNGNYSSGSVNNASSGATTPTNPTTPPPPPPPPGPPTTLGDPTKQFTQYETYRVGSPSNLPRFDYMFAEAPITAGGSYQSTNSSLKLFVYSTSTRTALYRCLIQYNNGDPKGPYSHFFSTTINCDGISGAIQDAAAGQQYIMGYLERNPVSGSSTPIYRCYDANLNRWRLATATSQCAQMKMSVYSSTPLGYAPSATVSTTTALIFLTDIPFTVLPGPYQGNWTSGAALDQHAVSDGMTNCISVNGVIVHSGFGPCLQLQATQ